MPCIVRIYKVTNPITNDFYIGGTKTHISCRLNTHRKMSDLYPNNKFYASMRDCGWENAIVEILETVELDKREEGYVIERRYVDTLKPKLNTNIPNRSCKEWQKDNRDKIRIYNAKARSSKPAGFYAEYKKAKSIICICGSTVYNSDLAMEKHVLTKKHVKYVFANPVIEAVKESVADEVPV